MLPCTALCCFSVARLPAASECDGAAPRANQPCKYVVADRPNAVRQFVEAARTNPTLIKARRAGWGGAMVVGLVLVIWVGSSGGFVVVV